MAELKTKRTGASVGAFLKGISDPGRRRDCVTVKRMMEKATRSKAAMWGSSIVGFGSYRYQYPSGQAGEWFLTGFSPRKQNLTLYCLMGYQKKALLRELGKFKTGGGCLYIKQLADVDTKVLDKVIRAAVKAMKSRSA
jgi:uncharacterized protein DUF1801